MIMCVTNITVEDWLPERETGRVRQSLAITFDGNPGKAFRQVFKLDPMSVVGALECLADQIKREANRK